MQEVHFDVILLGPEEEGLGVEGALFENEDLDRCVRETLKTEVNKFQELFEPRQRK